jgi:AcrR family transcriptional regulator
MARLDESDEMTQTGTPEANQPPAAAPRRPRHYANGIARREHILDAANELFVESGFRAVSLRDIAARAGLSHPGLLRHFPSKDAVLDALVDRFERDNERWIADHPTGEALPIVELARRNARVPGYVELFATLAGEATSPTHPAHARWRQRYRALRERTRVPDGRPRDGVLVSSEAWADAARFVAAWDGLQLLSLYDPDGVDVAARLERRLSQGAPVPAPGTPPPRESSAAALPGLSFTAAGGYAPGRERRARIVADATLLFTRGGFHDTTLQEIADAVGISKSTLLHHFSSKDELLGAVLAHRDATAIPPDGDLPADPLERLLALPRAARRDADETPGLIAIHAVLSCEAAAADHPAHEYFAQRFAFARAYFTDLFGQLAASGRLPADRDPEHEGTWLVAMWDGLQFQWLYEPDAVDVPALLAAHIRDVLGTTDHPARGTSNQAFEGTVGGR